jgi:hypothetical protein
MVRDLHAIRGQSAQCQTRIGEAGPEWAKQRSKLFRRCRLSTRLCRLKARLRSAARGEVTAKFALRALAATFDFGRNGRKSDAEIRRDVVVSRDARHRATPPL